MITCKIKKITIPDYGDLFIRRTSARTRAHISELMASQDIQPDQKDMRLFVEVLASVIVDEGGARIYGDARLEEIKDWDLTLGTRIIKAVQEFNTESDTSLETEIKNSNPSPSASSPTE